MKTILLSGDDAALLLSLRHTLSNLGYRVELIRNYQTLPGAIHGSQPDVIVVDLAILDIRAHKICQRLRKSPHTSDVPLIIVSQKPSPEAVASIFDAGADLFMSKPIVPIELAARIRALLRRREAQEAWHDNPVIEIDSQQRVARVDERDVLLTPVEFELLNQLCDKGEEYQSARQLLSRVWNYPDGSGDTALVRNHIRNLRFKLEQDPERPRIVESLPKRGYRVNAEVRWLDEKPRPFKSEPQQAMQSG